MNEFGFAIADLSKAIEISPVMASAYLERGAIFLNSIGDLVQAERDIHEALDRANDPRIPIVYRKAQDMLEELNNMKQQAIK